MRFLILTQKFTLVIIFGIFPKIADIRRRKILGIHPNFQTQVYIQVSLLYICKVSFWCIFENFRVTLRFIYDQVMILEPPELYLVGESEDQADVCSKHDSFIYYHDLCLGVFRG